MLNMHKNISNAMPGGRKMAPGAVGIDLEVMTRFNFGVVLDVDADHRATWLRDVAALLTYMAGGYVDWTAIQVLFNFVNGLWTMAQHLDINPNLDPEILATTGASGFPGAAETLARLMESKQLVSEKDMATFFLKMLMGKM